MRLSLNNTIIVFLSIGLIEVLQSCKDKPSIPSLTTLNVSDITYTSAISGGNISDDGGAEIIDRGICWGMVQNPIIRYYPTDHFSKTSDGEGIGTYTSFLSQLKPNSRYFIRAFATNSAGISYGNEISFTTKTILMATLTTLAVTSITDTSAVSGGNITADGGDSITARGVCWATTSNPTTGNSMTPDGTGKGIFSSRIGNLQPNITYHVRAYAINSAGTAYGDDISFQTKPKIYAIELVANLPIALNSAGVNSIVVNNSIYVLGGSSFSELSSHHIYKYTIIKNTWTDLGSILPYGTNSITNNIAAYSSTSFYITPSLGPSSTYPWGQYKDILEYDLSKDSISIKASFPENSWDISPIAYGDYIYMFGRQTYDSDHKDVYRYNPSTNILSNLGEILPYFSSRLVSVLANNGYIYLFGGRTYKRSLVIFDPSIESIKYHQETFLPFDFYGGAVWSRGSIIFLIYPGTGRVYEFNTLNNTLEKSRFQIFLKDTYYEPMVSQDGSTGIIYLIGGYEGSTTVQTVRKLIPIN
jgi:hypothetical protein